MFKKSKYLTTVIEKNWKIVFKEKEGYSFLVEDLVFGICKSGNGWDITEITSGLRIAFVSRREDAIEKIKMLIPDIKATLKRESNQKLIKMKEEYESDLQAEKLN